MVLFILALFSLYKTGCLTFPNLSVLRLSCPPSFPLTHGPSSNSQKTFLSWVNPPSLNSPYCRCHVHVCANMHLYIYKKSYTISNKTIVSEVNERHTIGPPLNLCKRCGMFLYLYVSAFCKNEVGPLNILWGHHVLYKSGKPVLKFPPPLETSSR